MNPVKLGSTALVFSIALSACAKILGDDFKIDNGSSSLDDSCGSSGSEECSSCDGCLECSACTWQGDCQNDYQACMSSSECKDYLSCYADTCGNDPGCAEYACYPYYPNGAALAQAAAQCAIQSACSEQCAN